MEASFGYFQKVKPNSLILNPNSIDCYSSGLIAATLMKYSQHLLQGRTDGIFILRDASIVNKWANPNEKWVMLWVMTWSQVFPCTVSMYTCTMIRGSFLDPLGFCCAAGFFTDVCSHILETTSCQVDRKDWKHQKFLGVCLAELGGSTQSHSSPQLSPGVVSSLFLCNGFMFPSFPFVLSTLKCCWKIG